MKRMMRWAAGLYPAAWRARYGEELEVLLEDAAPRWTDLLDLLRGALTMQMKGVSYGKIAAGFTIAGALAAGAWSLAFPDRYVSSAVLRIGNPAAGDIPDIMEARRRLQALQQTVLARQSLADIIVQQGLYRRERAKDPLEDIIQNMRNRDLRVQLLHGTQFTVSFASDNPATAQATVRAVVGALAEANVSVDRQRPVTLEVLDPASLPVAPSGPDRAMMIGRGLIAGLMLGVLCGALWSLVSRRKQWSWKRVGGFAVAGMALGITVAILMPDEYISTAVLRSSDAARLQAALQTAFSDASLQDVIVRNQLYQSQRRSDSMTKVVGKMRNTAIRVQTVRGPDTVTHAFTVSFQYPDRYKAQAVTRELVARITGNMPAEVLDPPSMPQAPSGPNRLQIAGIGLLAGALLGMAASRGRGAPLAAAEGA
jgi:hypothetical protein